MYQGGYSVASDGWLPNLRGIQGDTKRSGGSYVIVASLWRTFGFVQRPPTIDTWPFMPRRGIPSSSTVTRVLNVGPPHRRGAREC